MHGLRSRQQHGLRKQAGSSTTENKFELLWYIFTERDAGRGDWHTLAVLRKCCLNKPDMVW